MAKYTVLFARPVYDYAEVTIEAATQEEAERLAMGQIDTLEWTDGDIPGDPEVTDVLQVG